MGGNDKISNATGLLGIESKKLCTTTNSRMTLTCCGGKGGRARAAGVDRRQGWHSGAGAAGG